MFMLIGASLFQVGCKENDVKEKKVKVCSQEESTKTSSKSNVGEAKKQDFIHVRARRGQATDSHSLAERVRYLFTPFRFVGHNCTFS